MSKGSKRGLSLQEKRDKMMEIFYESQSVFQLKDLEKLGPKKGVISQSVKDVVQSLVDDDLVLKDKIGTSIYFWSFPSRAGNQLRLMQRKVEGELTAANDRQAELQKKLEQSRIGRRDSTERDNALTNLREMQKKHKDLKEELELYAGNDPVLYEGMKKSTQAAHDAANRWTDNVFIFQQWCSNTFPDAKEKLQEMYSEVGITEDFDTLT